MSDHVYRVASSSVDFENTEQLKKAGFDYIDAVEGPSIDVDVGEVKQANSLVIAVLLAWLRYARLKNKSIVFTNLSGDLRNIIAFSGLQDVLLPSQG